MIPLEFYLKAITEHQIGPNDMWNKPQVYFTSSSDHYTNGLFNELEFCDNWIILQKAKMIAMDCIRVNDDIYGGHVVVPGLRLH